MLQEVHVEKLKQLKGEAEKSIKTLESQNTKMGQLNIDARAQIHALNK